MGIFINMSGEIYGLSEQRINFGLIFKVCHIGFPLNTFRMQIVVIKF